MEPLEQTANTGNSDWIPCSEQDSPYYGINPSFLSSFQKAEHESYKNRTSKKIKVRSLLQIS